MVDFSTLAGDFSAVSMIGVVGDVKTGVEGDVSGGGDDSFGKLICDVDSTSFEGVFWERLDLGGGFFAVCLDAAADIPVAIGRFGRSAGVGVDITSGGGVGAGIAVDITSGGGGIMGGTDSTSFGFDSGAAGGFTAGVSGRIASRAGGFMAEAGAGW